MTPRHLKALARNRSVRANVLSDGCQHYLIEIETETGAGLLRGWNKRLLKPRNLGDAHQLLTRCGVTDIVLRQRIAQDEACAASPGGTMIDMPLKAAG